MRKWILLLVFIMVTTLLFGCSEREEPIASQGSTEKADTALKEAKSLLKSVGVKTSFDDPAELSTPEDLIPQPEELASLEKQKNIQKAMEQLNIVISEIEQEAKPAPSLAPIGSSSDRGIIHFYLGLVYVLDAISRIMTSDDPETTFILKYNPKANVDEWFTYGISEKTKAKLDNTKNPLDYPLAFTEKERQAIIDAVDLISDASVKPKSSNIMPQTSSVNGPPYYHFAIWHFEKAIALLGEYIPDIKGPLEEFNSQIDKFKSIIKKNSELWGFTYTSAPGR